VQRKEIRWEEERERLEAEASELREAADEAVEAREAAEAAAATREPSGVIAVGSNMSSV